MRKVVIGIQARSSSRRFPKKVFEKIGNKTVIEHVIDACEKASQYINNWGTKKIYVTTALLVPYRDELTHSKYDSTIILEGPEDDVLKRYALLAKATLADYVVRVTGDCPLIPSFIISKCISTAVMNQYDYFSNVEESCRTSADGTDCEVISKQALLYADEYAAEQYDREHVTPFIRANKKRFKQGTIVNFFDLSGMKLSLDTPEDLERIRTEYEKTQDAYEKAQTIFGRNHVHRV